MATEAPKPGIGRIIPNLGRGLWNVTKNTAKSVYSVLTDTVKTPRKGAKYLAGGTKNRVVDTFNYAKNTGTKLGMGPVNLVKGGRGYGGRTLGSVYDIFTKKNKFKTLGSIIGDTLKTPGRGVENLVMGTGNRIDDTYQLSKKTVSSIVKGPFNLTKGLREYTARNTEKLFDLLTKGGKSDFSPA